MIPEKGSSHRIISALNQITAVLLPLFLMGLLTTLLRWSWRRWPDIMVDFGRELYLPWQISSDQILYRDMTHLFGPLSAMFNAVWFKIFGPSFTVLITVNVILLTGFLTVTYLVLNRWTCRWTAFAGCGVIISMFALGHYTFFGNYNFITPYAHETIHGIYLSGLVIVLIARFNRTRLPVYAFLAGLCLGLIFLTKAEIFVSAAAATAVSFVIDYVRYRKSSLWSWTVLTAGTLIPPLGFAAYFSTVMNPGEAVRAVGGSWTVLLGTRVSASAFYQRISGMDDISGNVTRMVLELLVVLAVVPAVMGCSHILTRYRKRPGTAIPALAALILVTGLVSRVEPWHHGRSLPVLAFITILILVISLRKNVFHRDQILPVLVIAVFSLALTAKMALNCKLGHYGFYMAMPAAVTTVIMLIWFLPEWMNRHGSGGIVFKITMLIIIGIMAARTVDHNRGIYRKLNFPVTGEPDRILGFNPMLDPRVIPVKNTLDWINKEMAPNDTFCALPEGVMLNYLTRRPCPSRYFNLMFPEMVFYRENLILEDLKSASPEYILLVHKDTSEYGYDFFGKSPEYGKSIMDWVLQEYDEVALMGKEPLKNHLYGIKILRKSTDKPVIEN